MPKEQPHEMQKWGRDTARERYGKLHEPPLSQKSEEAPQCPEDKRGPDYDNNTPDNWVRGMGKGQAEGKPGFDKLKAGK